MCYLKVRLGVLETCALVTKRLEKLFLGRLPKVDLIILEGGKMSVRPSVRPQKVSSISMKFGI